MIKAQELRPGNLLNCNHFTDGSWRIIQITGVQISLGDTTSVSWTAKKVCPARLAPIDEGYTGIPLTPEILEKCGFEDVADGSFCISIDHNENSLLIQIYLPNKEEERTDYELWFSLDDGSALYNISKNPIRYLHQLQNLYFALTGEELTVQL